MSPLAAGPRAASATPDLGAGFLAALPLFGAYELGLRALADPGERAAAGHLAQRQRDGVHIGDSREH